MATLGKKRVGLKENEPEQVVSVRLKIAGIIDEMEYLRGDKNTVPASQERQRLVSLAQTKLEEACMFAVKAIYTK